MTQLLAPETLEFFVRYFLAGFVFMSVRSWFVAGERPRINETLIESLILSLVNQIVALGSLGWLESTLPSPTPAWFLVLQNVLQPMVLGALVGWLATRGWFPEGLRRIVMPTVRPVNSAFEFAFDDLAGPTYLILRFADGKEIFGFVGERSIASAPREKGGIYLEDIYSVAEDGIWHLVNPRRSAWIDTSELRSIEFIPLEEDTNG